MLPAVAPLSTTGRQILAYSVLVWAASLAFGAVAGLGPVYGVSAVVLGAVFVGRAFELQREVTPARAMRLFSYSITYVTLLFAAMAVDQLLHHV
jgi:protoheme IX farnesyltransferase